MSRSGTGRTLRSGRARGGARRRVQGGRPRRAHAGAPARVLGDPDQRARALRRSAVSPSDPPPADPLIPRSTARARHLHLFLHARGILSAGVRLNALGPYAAQQLLAHAVRPLVDAAAAAADMVKGADDAAGTWPLGEILAARHDLQHSRIFNS
jgi:hypothetical protein